MANLTPLFDRDLGVFILSSFCVYFVEYVCFALNLATVWPRKDLVCTGKDLLVLLINNANLTCVDVDLDTVLCDGVE